MKKISLLIALSIMLQTASLSAPVTQKLTTDKAHSSIVKIVQWVKSWF